MPSDRNVRGRAIAEPQSVSHSARATAAVGQLPGHGNPSHALPASRSAWLPSAANSWDVVCLKAPPRLRRFLRTERQSVGPLARPAQQARRLAPAGVVMHARRSIRGASSSQILRTDKRAYSWSELVTTRCSRRIRVSRPLLVYSRGWLRTVPRKGRATRPAAERGRSTYFQDRYRFSASRSTIAVEPGRVATCRATVVPGTEPTLGRSR